MSWCFSPLEGTSTTSGGTTWYHSRTVLAIGELRSFLHTLKNSWRTRISSCERIWSKFFDFFQCHELVILDVSPEEEDLLPSVMWNSSGVEHWGGALPRGVGGLDQPPSFCMVLIACVFVFPRQQTFSLYHRRSSICLAILPRRCKYPFHAIGNSRMWFDGLPDVSRDP